MHALDKALQCNVHKRFPANELAGWALSLFPGAVTCYGSSCIQSSMNHTRASALSLNWPLVLILQCQRVAFHDRAVVSLTKTSCNCDSRPPMGSTATRSV
jgi:hypothetical protein